MAISQEQQKRGLEHLKQIRRKYFSESSEAAEWWDNLTPEWRGVVLHAAAVTSGSGTAASAGAHTHPISQGDNANVSSGTGTSEGHSAAVCRLHRSHDAGWR